MSSGARRLAPSIQAFPKLSAKRLFDEVRAAGYPGGYKRVLDYVRATRPREPVEAPVRFETPAGRQGQVDFGTFTLPWGRRHALVIVLGYSRLLLPPWSCLHATSQRIRNSFREIRVPPGPNQRHAAQ